MKYDLDGQDKFMNRESTKWVDPVNLSGFVGFYGPREQWTIFPRLPQAGYRTENSNHCFQLCVFVDTYTLKTVEIYSLGVIVPLILTLKAETK